MSVVPMLLHKNLGLAFKMARGFFKMERTKLMKRHFENYDHMKNFCLIYMKLTPLCNLRCVMCGQRGDKGVLKGEFAANEAKSIVPVETYKKMIDLVRTVDGTFCCIIHNQNLNDLDGWAGWRETYEKMVEYAGNKQVTT